MAAWADISSAPTDREIIIGWKARPGGIGGRVFAKWEDSHYNGPGWYGEQYDSTWGAMPYEAPTHWMDAPDVPA